MQGTQRLGHLTFFKPDRNDKNLIIREKFQLFERDLQLFVTISLMFVKAPREADDNNIAFKERSADLVLPVLPRLESFHIQPGVDSIPGEAMVEFVNGYLVTVCVDKENMILLC